MNFASMKLNSELQQLESNLNKTVEAFERYQPFEKINCAADAKSLVMDPQKYFDETIIKHLDAPKTSGAVRVIAKGIAYRHRIDREGYQEAIRMPVSSDPFPEYDVMHLSEEILAYFTWDGKFKIKPGVLQTVDQPEFTENLTL